MARRQASRDDRASSIVCRQEKCAALNRAHLFLSLAGLRGRVLRLSLSSRASVRELLLAVSRCMPGCGAAIAAAERLDVRSVYGSSP
jgi:hypothetical protein